jgi:outer membrane protein assembly factor BamB
MSDTGETLIINNGAHYIGVDPKNGKIKYETKLRNCYNGDILSDNTFIALDTESAHGLISEMGPIVLFNLDSGQLIWETAESNIFDVIGVSPNCVYAETPPGYDQYYLIALDLHNGQELWNRQNLRYGGNGEEEFLGEFNGVTIISNSTKSITWGIGCKNGNVIWENDDLVLEEILGLSNNLIIGLSPKKFLYAIDITTGEKKWKIDVSQESSKEIFLDDSRKSHAGILKNNKIIYFSKGGLIIIDPSTGEKIENISVPNINSSIAFYLKENLLIIRSNSDVSIIKI